MIGMYSYSREQEFLHMRYGQVDKCIDVMCDLIHHASDDNDLIFQAKNGLLKKEIKVPDSECTSASGRKIFMINILNTSTYLKNRFVDTSRIGIHILANYRCFSFHLSKVDREIGMIELINKTLPEQIQLNHTGGVICLCSCGAQCGRSEITSAFSWCKCGNGAIVIGNVDGVAETNISEEAISILKLASDEKDGD